MKERTEFFKTDGELYDESLTRNTERQALVLYDRIVKRIKRIGYINIYWITSNFSKLPDPKNMVYAVNHGWIEADISKFHVEKKEGRFAVYLGAPRVLTPDIVLKKYNEKAKNGITVTITHASET